MIFSQEWEVNRRGRRAEKQTIYEKERKQLMIAWYH
jgi:hypothetical protein